jgi:hypothetical protein
MQKMAMASLLPQDDRQAAPPGLSESDAHNFHSKIDTAQENFRRRMKTKRRRGGICRSRMRTPAMFCVWNFAANNQATTARTSGNARDRRSARRPGPRPRRKTQRA